MTQQAETVIVGGGITAAYRKTRVLGRYSVRAYRKYRIVHLYFGSELASVKG